MEINANQQFIIRDKGYNVARTLSRGMKVRLLTDIYYRQPLAAGTIFEVCSTTNAGFRGMEVFGVLPDGEYVSTNCGNVEIVR